MTNQSNSLATVYAQNIFKFQEHFSNTNFLTWIILLNFKLVFQGVYCLVTKPQTTLPSALIMQPVTLIQTQRIKVWTATQKVTPKISTFTS